MALMTLQFAVPLAVLVFTYAKIALAVWGGRPPGEAENSRDRRMAKSKRKMIKMMVTVVIVFTVCWLPLNILIILWSINLDGSWDSWEPLPYVWFASHWLAMSHSCYNPIIYCYMNARFRYGFIQVAAKIPCLRACLSKAARRAAHADLHNGVGMTETTLHRVNTCTSYVSLRKRVARCSCSPVRNNTSPSRNNCSPARSSCSHTRSNCSPGRSTCSSNITLSPVKNASSQADLPYKRSTCITHSPGIGYSNRTTPKDDDLECIDTFQSARYYPQMGGCLSNNSTRNVESSAIVKNTPARAASLLTTQGTMCSNDKRHVTYMEDQI